MGEYRYYLTWPCGMKSSLEIKEFGAVSRVTQEDKAMPCPLHGLTCHRGA